MSLIQAILLTLELAIFLIPEPAMPLTPELSKKARLLSTMQVKSGRVMKDVPTAVVWAMVVDLKCCWLE
jgi:hypothetical protein